MGSGGATRFPLLNLDVRPKRGRALVFFPVRSQALSNTGTQPAHQLLRSPENAHVHTNVCMPQGNPDGSIDQALMHEACEAMDTKWVAQVWVRHGADRYNSFMDTSESL